MVLKFFTGKSLYDADEKEKEEAEEKIQTLDTQVLLLIAMNNMMDDIPGGLILFWEMWPDILLRLYFSGRHPVSSLLHLTAPS